VAERVAKATGVVISQDAKSKEGHLPFVQGMETTTSMAPLKMRYLGWQSTHQVFLAHYGSSTSSPHGTLTQKADYAGVHKDAIGL